MSDLKPLFDIFGRDDDKKEVYVSDQKKRYWRSQNGRFSRTKGLFNFLQLIKNWEAIVGKMMAQNTIPLKIKGQTLFISTKHSIFAQELGFLTPMILEKVKVQFPELENEVNKIKFLHSNLTSQEFTDNLRAESFAGKPKKKKKKLHPFSPEFLAKKSKAESYFDDIEDEEIKKMLTDFMLSN
jgi:hypothetical protein